MVMSSDHADLVMAEAREWLGTPYHDQASLKGVGCDCLGLVRGVWRAVVGPEPMDMPKYSRSWAETGTCSPLMEGARQWLVDIPKREIAPGNVMLFRMRDGALPKHMGIAMAPGTFIHAWEGRGVGMDCLSPPWRRRIVAVFRFPRAG